MVFCARQTAGREGLIWYDRYLVGPSSHRSVLGRLDRVKMRMGWQKVFKSATTKDQKFSSIPQFGIRCYSSHSGLPG